MSDASPRQREWRFYVDDMVAFANTVLSYTEGLDQTAFVGDRRTYDATLRKLELIGEAASHLPQEIREQHPGIPWRLVIATRNRLIHGYLGIDDDTLWTIFATMCHNCWRSCRSSSESSPFLWTTNETRGTAPSPHRRCTSRRVHPQAL